MVSIIKRFLYVVTTAVAVVCFTAAVPAYASLDTDAYDRIMKTENSSSAPKKPEVKRTPSVDDIPTPPIKKSSASSAAPKTSSAVKSKPMEKVKPIAKVKDPENDVDDTYILQNGDVVTIKIYPEDEYIKGGQTEVSSEGNITLPLVGKVQIAGKSVVEAERYLVAIIDKDYLVNPEVVIEVQQHKKQSIVILGQVKKPGPYELPPGSSKLTLLQAIALAGGFTEVANIKKIKIVRQGSGKSQILSANADSIISGKDQDIELEPGDAINVSESLF